MSSKKKTTATKEDGKPALVPKLRFPEFREAEGWDTVLMANLYCFKRNNTYSRDKLNYESGVVKNIHYGDIHTKFSTLFNITKECVPFINRSEVVPAAAAAADYCVEGDLIFADASEDTNDVGKSIEIVYLNNELLVSGQHTILARRNDERLVVGFAGYLFRSSRIRSQIETRSQGTKVYQISSSRLANVNITFPSDKTEQQKIAECLSSVDELMAAQSRKVDALKTHKKGLMQQLFPREGETQPRLRFPEFQNAGEWDPVTFGALGLDVSDGNYSSKYPSQSDFVAKGVPFLRANNLRFGTVSDDDMRFISKEQHSQITKGHLKKGDILITTRGELGTVALVPDRHIGSNINAQIVRINTGNKLVNTFLFQLFDYSRVIGLFEALSTGTALKQLPIGKLNQLALHIPAVFEEQQRIADCLTSLDDLIAAQTQKHAALKTHKKGLMQQLFPSPEEIES